MKESKRTNPPSARRSLILAGGGLLVLVVLAMSVFFLSGSPFDAAASGPAWLDQSIQEMELRLQAAVNPTERALLDDKLQRLRQLESNRLMGGVSTPTVVADPCLLRPTTEPAAETARIQGAVQVDLDRYEDLGLLSTSRWEQDSPEGWLAVLVGALIEDPEQGIVILFRENAPYETYPAPAPGGALRILEAQSERLTLEDETGALIYFDVPARQFLSDPSQVVPSLVPQPTFTPAPPLCP